VRGRSGQEATFCSYGVYRRDRRPLYDGSQEHLCTMEATESKKETKSTKETKGPCTMEKVLVLFCTMEASETKCPCTMEKALLFVLPDS